MTEPAAETRAAETVVEPTRQQRALAKAKTYAAWSAGAGLIPVPALDLLAVSGVQLKMLSDIADIYGVPFKRELGKNLLSGLLGGLVPLSIAQGTASAFKAVPVFGALTALLLQPTLSGAAAYAIAKVFILHFESGGTLLDFDPGKVREHFQKEFDAARAGAKAETAGPV